MALIKLSSLAITNISGKAGGTVYAHNKGGAYARDFAVPSNPKSQSQQQVRAQFGLYAGQWRGLTQDQRNAWTQAAPNFPVLDPFGDVKTLSGISLYVQLNRNLSLIGTNVLTFPPAPAGTQAVASAASVATQTTDGDAFTLTSQLGFATEDLDDMTVVAYATPPVSPGVTNANNRMRMLGASAASGTIAGWDLAGLYTGLFGQPPIDGNIRLRFDVINNVTGERSASFFSGVFVDEAA